MTVNAISLPKVRSSLERDRRGQLWGTRTCTLTAEMIGLIESHVQNRLSGRLRDFRVLVREKGLVLRGQVRTYYAKQLAQHAVMDRTEIPILANEIDVL
jgi:hypothetical protein